MLTACVCTHVLRVITACSLGLPKRTKTAACALVNQVYLDATDLPLVKVVARGVVSIRARGSQEYEHYVDHISYFNELYGAKISDGDVSRLRKALLNTEPVADIIDIRLWGRGSPYGSWRWHRSSLYTGYSAGFLSIGSLGLLAPRTFAMDISLERSFCSLDDSEAGRADFGTSIQGMQTKLHWLTTASVSARWPVCQTDHHVNRQTRPTRLKAAALHSHCRYHY